MKKIVLRTISIVMFLIMIMSVILLIVTLMGNHSSGGFLDLTDVLQYFLIGVEIISGVIAFITGKLGWKSEQE